MQVDEIELIVNDVNDLTERIIRAQQTLNNIKKEIDKTSLRPFEQDYIYSDHFGSKPSETKTHEINGVTFITRILHQTGTHLSDISGADLLYEIEGEKYLIVQYKRPDKKDRIVGDIPQLKNLISSCPIRCNGAPPKRINGFCGSWYNIQDESKSQYIHACEAFQTFGIDESKDRAYFKKGLTKSTFTELFASCRIGAPTSVQAIQFYITYSIIFNRMIFHVNQLGQF